ncbi:MAG: hypothetical protein L6R40_002637 [Gallowayella cf. fulva]|nr:MAG: hypothetical protein L6R40_002637 [Xanthomendoza cf. fulva]
MATLRYPASRTILRFQQRLSQSPSSPAARKYGGTSYHWSIDVKSPKNHKSNRPFHESQKQQNRFDESSIDFTYMPQHALEEAAPPEVIRIPRLPHNFSKTSHEEAVESVVRPQISLVSANSTHIESPSAMSDVTDNHAVELDPFDLTNKVTAAASMMAELPLEKVREAGTVRQLWSGLMDDLFGSKSMSRA